MTGEISMKCPFCFVPNTKVVDSRDADSGRGTRRRRECGKCRKRFTTYEIMESLKISVVKRDGRKEEYSGEKVRSGIEKALEKRPVSQDDINRIVSDVEYELYARGEKEIGSREIGKLIMKKLKEIDEVAYIRFASVYKAFGSASSFQKEIKKLEI